jgi:YbgC/YbaW family acyl-CoA thioester hydrolase
VDGCAELFHVVIKRPMNVALPEVVFHIYPADCDMLGHVNHATMLGFLERARWELLEREEVGGVRDFARVPIVSVVRHVDIDYYAQSLPGEDLAIRSGLLAIRNTSYIVKQDVKKVRDGTLVARASIVFVAVDRSGKPVRVPAEWHTLLPHWPENGDDAR